jgi:hypothetical protein
MLAAIGSIVSVAQAAPSCPSAPPAYRVYLKQGAEYVDVDNPRVEHGQLVYHQYGGEVRQDADNLLKIEPRSPETAEMLQQAMAWERQHLQILTSKARQQVVLSASVLPHWQVNDFSSRLDLLEAAGLAYIQAIEACGR